MKMGMTPETALKVYGGKNKLKFQRVKKGLSQSEFAEASGVKLRTIQTYENGSRQIDKANLMILCQFAKALDCKIEDILENEELIELFKQCK